MGAGQRPVPGAVRRERRPGLLDDVLLVPSIGLESFGLAAREAMASGVR